MNWRTCAFLAATLVSFTATSVYASAEVKITIKFHDSSTNDQILIRDGSPAPIQFSTDNTMKSISIRSNLALGFLADVGPVTIGGDHGGTIPVTISGGIRHLDGVTTSANAQGVHIAGVTISGDLKGPIKSPSVGATFIGGDIKSGAHIEATVGQLSQVFVTGGSVESGVELISQSGNTWVQITNGDFLGDILLIDASSQAVGSLSRLDVLNGQVGTSTTTQSVIRAKSIGSIDVQDNIFADIVVGNGQVSSLDSTLETDEIIVRNGNFVGSFIGNTINEMAINGDLEADIEVFTVADSAMTETEWRVGGSFTAGNTITLTDDLAGQITFNNNNAGGTWSGDVVVDGVTLNTVSYAPTAASLGGGAVGLVPFTVHRSSSVPEDQGHVDESTNDPVTVRHYGPVGLDGLTSPVSVSRTPRNFANFTDQTAGFGFSINSSDSRELIATPVAGYVFRNGYEYSIVSLTAGPDRLFCVDAVGGPDVSLYKTIFTVGTPCPSDINGDWITDTADLGLLLGNWGESGLSEEGDLNNDLTVDTADLGLLLGEFNENCGNTMAAMAGGGNGPSASSLLQELGFRSIESYTTWLDSLTERECLEHVCLLMEMIEEH